MSELSKIGERKGPLSTLPEVEFALVLSRIISSAKDDPEQLRNTVYELARMKLRKDLFGSDPSELTRLVSALETAIHGVEDFSRRQEDGSRYIGDHRSKGPSPPRNSALMTQPESKGFPNRPASSSTLLPARGNRSKEYVVSLESPAGISSKLPPAIPLRVTIGLMFVALLLGGAALYRFDIPGNFRNTLMSSRILTPKAIIPKQLEPAIEPSVPAPTRPLGDVPLPTTYGVYGVVNGKLAELELLPGNVPDKRVAVSSAINTASRVSIDNNSPTFVVFRRDLSSLSAERIEARVVAKITRTMKFDATAKSPAYAPEDLWAIRSFSYPFRMSPVPDNPDMLIVRPEKPDEPLPAGRYVIVLKRQGYDFTVAGQMTDPQHCLERVEAANGMFYAACKAK